MNPCPLPFSGGSGVIRLFPGAGAPQKLWRSRWGGRSRAPRPDVSARVCCVHPPGSGCWLSEELRLRGCPGCGVRDMGCLCPFPRPSSWGCCLQRLLGHVAGLLAAGGWGSRCCTVPSSRAGVKGRMEGLVTGGMSESRCLVD